MDDVLFQQSAVQSEVCGVDDLWMICGCCFSKVLSKVKEEDTLNLMDELIYKLSVNNDISIAA